MTENDATIRDLMTSVMRLSEDVARLTAEIEAIRSVSDRLYSASLRCIGGRDISSEALADWAEVEQSYRKAYRV